MKDPCYGCGFLNEYGYCECSSLDKWYACPIENKKPENVEALREYAETQRKESEEMMTFYICGYPRNQDGTIRKNAKRKVLDIAHTVEEAKERVSIVGAKYMNKYDVRIYDGRWNEIK